MRKMLISAAMLSALALAAPASAQYHRAPGHGYGYDQGYQRGGQSIQRELGQIVERIRRAESRRHISRSEARRLYRKADKIDARYDRYRRNGISPSEYRDLQHRINDLRRDLRWERWDR